MEKLDFSNRKSVLKDYRCPYCNKLFFYGSLSSAIIEIKCRGCKSVKTIYERGQ